MVDAKLRVRVILWKKFVVVALHCVLYLDQYSDQHPDQQNHCIGRFFLKHLGQPLFGVFACGFVFGC